MINKCEGEHLRLNNRLLNSEIKSGAIVDSTLPEINRFTKINVIPNID